VDKVGGEMLTWLTRTVDFLGNIASIGLAGKRRAKTTVMPFILRGSAFWDQIRPPRRARSACRLEAYCDGSAAANLDRIVTGRSLSTSFRPRFPPISGRRGRSHGRQDS